MYFKPGSKVNLTIEIPLDASDDQLDRLKKEWEQGGALRLGELLIYSLDDIWTVENVASRLGITKQAVTKKARQVAKEGSVWPRKRKGVWEAPWEEWEKLFPSRKDNSKY